MRYFVQFIHQGAPYFVFPTGANPARLQSLAEGIIRNYFGKNSDNPQSVPPDPRIPNEVRIVDSVGQTVAKWSLAEEYSRRQKMKAS